MGRETSVSRQERNNQPSEDRQSVAYRSIWPASAPSKQARESLVEVLAVFGANGLGNARQLHEADEVEAGDNEGTPVTDTEQSKK